MAQRKSLTKTLRFEVFKRDSFTCQYCGAKAPDVILEVDHINPVSNGGDDSIMNLITSCFNCNRGKSDKQISDNSIITKQRKQIEDLNLRRLQLEMLLEWKTLNVDFENEISQKAINYFNQFWLNFSLSESGENDIRKLVKKYGIEKVIHTIEISYNNSGNDYGYNESERFDRVLRKVLNLLFTSTLPEYEQKIRYIKGICKNKFDDCKPSELVNLLFNYYERDGDLDMLTSFLKNNHIKTYSDLRERLCV